MERIYKWVCNLKQNLAICFLNLLWTFSHVIKYVHYLSIGVVLSFKAEITFFIYSIMYVDSSWMYVEIHSKYFSKTGVTRWRFLKNFVSNWL